MTAVEQFFEDLCHLGYIEYPDENLVQDRLNLALEMEKEQIINAINFFKHSLDVCDECGEGNGWYGDDDLIYNCSKCNPFAK